MASEKIAVINSNADVVEMLRVALEQEGLSVATALTGELRDGSIDLTSFMREHDPSVVLYDVSAPYDANWALFEQFRARPEMLNRPVVLTSTDAASVELIAARDAAIIGIVARPFDLDVVIGATKAALCLPFRELPPARLESAWRHS